MSLCRTCTFPSIGAGPGRDQRTEKPEVGTAAPGDTEFQAEIDGRIDAREDKSCEIGGVEYSPVRPSPICWPRIWTLANVVAHSALLLWAVTAEADIDGRGHQDLLLATNCQATPSLE